MIKVKWTADKDKHLIIKEQGVSANLLFRKDQELQIDKRLWEVLQVTMLKDIKKERLIKISEDEELKETKKKILKKG